jgi:hypothetical protein
MTLHYMNPNTIQAVLTRAWQKVMATDLDPANGQWYTSGPTGDLTGLYGGLNDSIDSVATVGAASYATDPDSLKQTIAAQSTVDNRNGLMTAPLPVTLSHTYSTTQAFTHTPTRSVMVGLSEPYSLHIAIPGASIGASAAFSFDKTGATSDSTADTTTTSSTFQQTVQVLPPKGKVYQAVLSFIQNKATVPYWLYLHASGMSDATFATRVYDHFGWMNAAPTLVSALTADDFTALGLHPTGWGVDQNGIWTKGVVGQLEVDLIGGFNISIIDITSQTPSFAPGAQLDRFALTSMLVPHQALG